MGGGWVHFHDGPLDGVQIAQKPVRRYAVHQPEVKDMKSFVTAIFVMVILLWPAMSWARHGKSSTENDATILAACPMEGDAKNPKVKALNLLKRRMMTPSTADMDSKVTLTAMFAPGDDTNRFNDTKGATIEGYVADVKVGGVESVNCHTHDPKYRDTHIELTLDPLHDDETKHVIVEITPQWREVMASKGVDWSTSTLRARLLGKWVEVTGWLLFDEEHANAAENTAPGAGHIWRATVWEIHPITGIEILPQKP